jgi:L-serine dehydratase
MDSLRELFKIGNGPSSSHTMGPQKAAQKFKDRNPDAASFRVELYGSLAATGKGHLTDWIIIETLKPKRTEIVWKPEVIKKFHTNGMKFFSLNDSREVLNEWLVFSVGGGSIMEENEDRRGGNKVYDLSKMSDIMKWCDENSMEFWQYVGSCEGEDIWEYLKKIWAAMEEAIVRGLNTSGILPGELKYPRKAQRFYKKARMRQTRFAINGKIYAYSLAVSEENAAGGEVVTAPTCGASGVVPGLLKALKEEYDLSEDEVIKALSIAGLIGNIVKENASISGAEVGCQGEVGTACAMAAGMASYILGGTLEQIEYAAEMALEHHLGMTCDPVGGYVQIPCIERNAVAAVRALDAANYTLFTDGKHRVSLDQVIVTMGETGRDLNCAYKETSQAGLAKYYQELSKYFKPEK